MGKIPQKNILVSIGPAVQKQEFLQHARLLVDMGFQLYATKNTHDVLVSQGGISNCIMVYKPTVRREPNVSAMLRGGKIDLVINVPDSMDSLALTDGFEVRRMAVDSGIPLLVELKTAILTSRRCIASGRVRPRTGSSGASGRGRSMSSPQSSKLLALVMCPARCAPSVADEANSRTSVVVCDVGF